MACKNCSKIRCKLFSALTGYKAKFHKGYYCGAGGAACQVEVEGYGTQEVDFGNTKETLVPYLKLLIKTTFNVRIKRKVRGYIYRGYSL